jgi:hypothetical protein
MFLTPLDATHFHKIKGHMSLNSCTVVILPLLCNTAISKRSQATQERQQQRQGQQEQRQQQGSDNTMAAAAAAAAATSAMLQETTSVLRWLQMLVKVTRIRPAVCKMLLLTPEVLCEQQQQQQQQHHQTAAVQQALWKACQGLGSRLSVPDTTKPCRFKAQQGCLLQRLLLLLPQLVPGPFDTQGQLLTEAVTLLLLLLYDSKFKYDTTTHLLDCYDWLLQLVGNAQDDAVADALSAALDRLTVQLFNSEQVRGVAGVVGGGGGLPLH